MMTAEADGWESVRRATFRRDIGCIAGQPRIFGVNIAPDMCKDAFGNPMRWDEWRLLEWDHVKEDLRAGVKAPNDEAHGVAVCPWHHRLSQRWRSDSKAHRAAIRDWLARHYPEVWNATP